MSTLTIPKRFGDVHREADRKIWFDFAPRGDLKTYAVEKAEGKTKRRYLYGISSGVGTDGHGERMTERCIKGFQEQAKSGDILLFAGKHEVNFTDDIGKLVGSEIDGNGDWMTTYRLYDELDGMGDNTLEAVDKVWRQINGISPYGTPRQYGFSIEGDIPEGGIARMDVYGHRIMDSVDLAGVVLVRKPAYRTSIAFSIAKALDYQARRDEEDDDFFYDRYFNLADELERGLRKAMKSGQEQRPLALQTTLDDYKTRMVELCLQFPNVFRDDPGTGIEALDPSLVYEPSKTTLETLRARIAMARDDLARLRRIVEQKDEEATNAEKQHDAPYGDPQ